MSDRAVSTVLAYVLVIGILALLLTALIGGLGGLVAEQQTESNRVALTVVAHDLAGSIETADRLASQGDETHRLALTSSLPDRVGDETYVIEVREEDPATNEYAIVVRIGDDHRVVVSVSTRVPIEDGSLSAYDGGPIKITYEGNTLVISRA